MYNHKKAQQSKNRLHISWDILYAGDMALGYTEKNTQKPFYFLAFSAIITQKTSILDFSSINLQHSQCMVCEKSTTVVNIMSWRLNTVVMGFWVHYLEVSPMVNALVHVVCLYIVMQ